MMSSSRRNSLVRRNSLRSRSNSLQHSSSDLDVLKHFQASPIKIDFKTVDMEESMQQSLEHIATEAIETCTSEKEIAAFIRKEMEKMFNKTWNVVVGQQFGSDVTHEAKKYAQLQYGQMNMLIWKSG